MYLPRIKQSTRAIAAGVTLGVLLAGCSDIYYARRETIALSGGDAVAANTAEQMVDPWPPASGNPNIPANGQKMQIAVERYRTDKVIAPINPTTSDVENAQLSQTQAAAAAAPAAASAPTNMPPGAAPPPSGAPGQ